MNAFWTRTEQGLPEQPGWYIGLCGDTPETLRFVGSGWHHTRITRDLAQPRAWAAFDALPALNDVQEQPEAPTLKLVSSLDADQLVKPVGWTFRRAEHPTKEAAVSQALTALDAQQAKLTKQQTTLNKKRAVLQAAIEALTHDR